MESPSGLARRNRVARKRGKPSTLAAMAHSSTTENEVILTEYFAMLEQELAGQDYVKARHNERVRDRTGRSKGSV